MMKTIINIRIKKSVKHKTVCISVVDNALIKYLKTTMEALMHLNLNWSTRNNPIFSFQSQLRISMKEIYMNLHF